MGSHHIKISLFQPYSSQYKAKQGDFSSKGLNYKIFNVQFLF